MAEDKFRLPGSSYAELVKIVRAYGHAPDEAVPKDVADRAGVDPTQVSRNNGFLVSVGVLSGGKKKSLTVTGRALAQALDFEMPDQIEAAWRTVAQDSDFLPKIVSAVRIRGGMEPSALRNHVAYTAGQPKNPRTLTGAGSVVDVLKAAALIREEDGKVVATADADVARAETPTPAPAEFPGIPTSSKVNVAEIPVSGSGVTASLSIEVRIDCRPEDLAALGPQLRDLLESLAGPAANDREAE